MKKVCHITSAHPYNDNRIFFKECVSLSNNGYDTYLVAPVPQDFVESGVQIIAVGRFKSRTIRMFLGPWQLLRRVIKIKPSVVHIHDPEVTIIVPILKSLGYKVIYDIHEDNKAFILEKKYLPKALRLPISWVLSAWEQVVVRMANPVIAERYYEDRFPNAIKILNYPLDNAPNTAVKGTDRVSQLCFDETFEWFIYTGNVTLERGAVENLKLLLEDQRAAICYVGKCNSEVYSEIQTYMRDNRIEENRFVLIGLDDYIPQSDIEYVLRNYKWRAGLALFPYSPFIDRKELTKFFDYAAADVPTLCSDFPHWRELAATRRLGVGYTTSWKKDLEEFHLSREPMNVPSWKSEESKLLDLYVKLV